MRPLHRKLFRDLWQIKGQALAIGLVIASGVTMFIMYLTNFQSLRWSQQSYYERCRFAEVFVSLKRAPLSLEERIAAIPGVAEVQSRVVFGVNLDVADLPEPAVGRLVSIPERDRDTLNDIVLRRGRYLDANRPDEVLVNENFAEARGLGPGDTIGAVLNGRRRELRIVGVALSPEYLYSIRPGEFIPDDGRYGVFWMARGALATAFDMEGGFNDLALDLVPGASEGEVIGRLDRLLEPYGGFGAIPRALQLSHWTVNNELTQLQTMGFLLPVLFLSVAAFLLSVVLRRIVAVQREQIAALKALGYSNREIGLHYAAWGLAIALAGGLVGVVAGAFLGRGLLGIYNGYFRFPEALYLLSPGVVLGAASVSVVAGLLGALAAVRRAVALPPAEAMRPEPPASYDESWAERLGLKALLSPPLRMVLRNVQRQPGRSLASILGIAMAVAILVVGTFFLDALRVLMDVQFSVIQRQDVTLSFVEPVSAAALHEIRRLPGVIRVEPMRAVPARLRSGHRVRQVAITGLDAEPLLQRVLDTSLATVDLPPEGLILSTKLAEVLGVRPGDDLTVEVLEGGRPVRQAVVAGLADEFLGTSVFMDKGALHRLMRESGVLSGAFLQVDEAVADRLYRLLKSVPAVSGVNLKAAALASFRDTMAQNLFLMIFFNVGFSSIIAFGVVYNAARISLSERSRELASLRVLGFTRGEISKILLGELAVVTLAAIPLGLALGYGLASLLVAAFDTELYRFPLVVSRKTYAFAAITVLVAAAASAFLVRRRLDHLDLIAVLKTKE